MPGETGFRAGASARIPGYPVHPGIVPLTRTSHQGSESRVDRAKQGE